MTFLNLLWVYKWTILFYSVLIAIIYIFRKKFDWQAKFIGLYRTKIGLKLMTKLANYKRTVRFLGYTGVVVGFTGMLLITYMLLKGLFDFFLVPTAPPVIAPVLPGITIPGLNIYVPLVIGWLALFIVIIIHEFSHGVVARAHNIPVKSSGLMLFGPLGGAFVEPDEKILRKKSHKVQLSVFGAGPFSNILSSILFWLVLLFLLTPLISSFIAPTGVVFKEVQPGYPAALSGVKTGVVYNEVNGAKINTTTDFLVALKDVDPNESVTLQSNKGQVLKFRATESPRDKTKGYIGVVLDNNLKNPSLSWLFSIVTWLTSLVTWTFILGLGIGLANLLPLGPVDGGRMFQIVTERFFGKKLGQKVWVKTSIVVLVLILFLLFAPIVRSLL